MSQPPKQAPVDRAVEQCVASFRRLKLSHNEIAIVLMALMRAHTEILNIEQQKLLPKTRRQSLLQQAKQLLQ